VWSMISRTMQISTPLRCASGALRGTCKVFTADYMSRQRYVKYVRGSIG
jgi:hypothetical protein